MNSEEVKRFTDDEKVSMADEYAEALITVIGADGSEKAYAREDFIMGLNKAESIYIPKIEQLQSDNKRLRDVVEGIKNCNKIDGLIRFPSHNDQHYLVEWNEIEKLIASLESK